VKENFTKVLKKNSNLYDFEYKIWEKSQLVCGIDEVGRGCLAGPIITAAVILKPHAIQTELKDSKLLNSRQLENIYKWIIQNSSYAIGISNNRLIDQKNIYATTQLTMKKALFHLLQSIPRLPDIIAIDAMPLCLKDTPYSTIPIESWTQGESKSASIAAASIVAKVTRDQLLYKIHHAFPSYGFNKHKGYGTANHIAALKQNQASIIHRKTFIKNFQKGVNRDQTFQQNLFYSNTAN